MEDVKHVPVLLWECIEGLNIDPNGIYVDGTLGRGGHSERIAERLQGGRLVGVDRDSTAIKESGERLERFGERVTLVKGNFRDIFRKTYGISMREFRARHAALDGGAEARV